MDPERSMSGYSGYRKRRRSLPVEHAYFFRGAISRCQWRWTGVLLSPDGQTQCPSASPKSHPVQTTSVATLRPDVRCIGTQYPLLTIQPDERISLRFGVKYPYSPNQIYTVNMTFGYQETFKTKFIIL